MWDEERGFGFIAPTQGGAELFVHISALPRDGARPVVGERVSFELGRGRDGRPQAVKVLRTAVGSGASARPSVPSPARPGRHSGGRLRRWLGKALLVMLVVAVASWGYGRFQRARHRSHLESLPAFTSTPVNPPNSRAAPADSNAGFRCDGRTHCAQMTSCAEATWFINHCPGTQMDGNHDGVPCEQQWCTGAGAR